MATYKPTFYTPAKKTKKKDIQEEIQEMIEEQGVPITDKRIKEVIQEHYKEKNPGLSREAKASLNMIQTDPALAEQFKAPAKKELIAEELEILDDGTYGVAHSETASLFKAEEGNEHLSLKEKSEIEAKRLADKWGMSIMEARKLVKEYVFSMKKNEEINAKMAEIKERKRRIKEMNKTLDNIRRNEFRIEEDKYDDIKNIIGKKVKDEYMGLMTLSKHVLKDPDNQPYTEKKFQRYRLQTEIRIHEYVEEYLSRPTDTLLTITKGQNIYLEKILLNEGISVVDVFWSYDGNPATFKPEMNTDKALEDVSRKLTRYAQKKLEFEMMRDMSFKKKIEIRFSPSKSAQLVKQLEDGFKEQVVEIAKETLAEELQEEGLNPDKITPAMIERSVRRLENDFMDVMADRINYRTMRLKYLEDLKKKESKKPKFDKEGKRIRDNKNSDGTKKKYVKKKKAEDFWQSISKE